MFNVNENFPLLTILLLLPVFVSIFIGVAPARTAKNVALAGALITFAFSLFLFLGHSTSGQTFLFSERTDWLPELGLSYHVGADGVTVLLLILTTFLHLLAVAISPAVPDRPKAYFIALTLLQAAIVGAFSALDLILFFIFFEASLVPSFFLIGIWGGKRRQAAGVKFFVYTSIGSLAMLAGILALHFAVRGISGTTATFDYTAIQATLATNPLPANIAFWIFLAFAFAFAIKTPLWPLHTWQSDTYAESPTAATVMLAAVLSKLGTYGFYRFCIGLFPDTAQQLAPFIIALAVVGIIYGALVATVQKDAKRLIAFSSVSHLGFVVLGLFAFTPQALTGAILQMVNHGISTGALFILLAMLESRGRSTTINDLGGLWDEMPVYSRIFLVVVLSSIALPLTNGFVGEFMILLGAFQRYPWATIFATTGVIWSAIYLLWMFQRAFYGLPKTERPPLRDISTGELLIAVPLVVLIFFFGIVPAPFAHTADDAVTKTLKAAIPVAQAKPKSTVKAIVHR